MLKLTVPHVTICPGLPYSMSATKRKTNVLTIETKLKIINEVDDHNVQ